MDIIRIEIKNPRKKALELVISPEHCKGCGFCVEFCPKQVLALSKGRHNAKGYSYAQPVKADACIGCGLCEMYCPDFAIFLSDPSADAEAEPETITIAIESTACEETNGED